MTPEELYEAYLSPPWGEPGRREREFLDSGAPLAAATEYGPVRGRLWPASGEPRGSVLLMHGWAGRAGGWLVLAPMLTEAGYDVVAYDAPGHGDTRGPDGPPRSHFFAFAATLNVAPTSVGTPNEQAPEGGRAWTAVIGHSFGASAIPYAIAHGLRTERAVLIGATARTESWLPRWAATRGLTEDQIAAIHTVWLREFGEDVLHRTDPVRRAREMPIPALILHDAGDAEAPAEDGRELAQAWPNATYEETTGLGHRRILLSRPAMARVAAFIGGTTSTPTPT